MPDIESQIGTKGIGCSGGPIRVRGLGCASAVDIIVSGAVGIYNICRNNKDESAHVSRQDIRTAERFLLTWLSFPVPRRSRILRL